MYVCVFMYVCDSTDVSIDLGTKTVTVTCDSGACDVAALAPAVTAAGYEATLVGGDRLPTKSKAATRTAPVALARRPANSPTMEVSLVQFSPLATPGPPTLGVAVVRAMFTVTGMTCASCVGSIERHVGAMPGVVTVTVALLSERMEVRGAHAHAHPRVYFHTHTHAHIHTRTCPPPPPTPVSLELMVVWVRRRDACGTRMGWCACLGGECVCFEGASSCLCVSRELHTC